MFLHQNVPSKLLGPAITTILLVLVTFLPTSFMKPSLSVVRTSTTFGSTSFAASNQTLKLFLHIGPPKTGTTSIQHAMAHDQVVLKNDGYLTKYVSIQFAACLWSEVERERVSSLLLRSWYESCPPRIHEFHKFLLGAKEKKCDVVVSSEALAVDSSEDGIGKIIIDNIWDVKIYMYYRRFYSWLPSMHSQLHREQGWNSPSSWKKNKGMMRLVDYIRDCFEGGEHLFSLQNFSSTALPDNLDTFLLKFLHSSACPFLETFTYYVRRRYIIKKNTRHRDNVEVVNFHQDDVVTTFYCDVLQARESCKLQAKRSKAGIKLNVRDNPGISDLVACAWFKGFIEVGGGNSATSKNSALKWNQVIKDRMQQEGLSEWNLPQECLSKQEQEKLLGLSLAFAKVLLPEASFHHERKEILKDFASLQNGNGFCSPDCSRVFAEEKWHFLFDPFKSNESAR